MVVDGMPYRNTSANGIAASVLDLLNCYNVVIEKSQS